MEISGDVTDAGRTYGRTREDRATQPMDAGWLSFAIQSHNLPTKVLILKMMYINAWLCGVIVVCSRPAKGRLGLKIRLIL